MKRVLKKVLKITGFVALSILLLLVLIGVLLQLPAIQTYIAKKATTALAEKTGGKLSVSKVAVRLPDAVLVQGIFAEDLNGDTLLYTGALKVNIGLFALLQKQVNIDNVILEDAVLNLNQNIQDSTFNFQYLIDAFAGDTTQPQDTTPSAWKVSINSVNLNNVRAAVVAPVSGFAIRGTIGDLKVEGDEIDFEKQIIALNTIALKNSTVAIVLDNADTAADKTTPDTAKTFLIPSIGWKLSAANIDFADNTISIDDKQQPPLAKGMDFAHLHLSGLNIKIENALYENHLVKGAIRNITAKERNSLELKEFEGTIAIDSGMIALDKIKIRTTNSRVQTTSQVKFPSFYSLQNLTEDVEVNMNFNESHLSLKDLLLVVPDILDSADLNVNALDSVFLDGTITGTIGDLKGDDFIFSLNQDDARVHVDFTAKGLPDMDKAYFTVNIEEISIHPRVLNLLKIELPQEVMRLGKTNLKGKYAGTIRKMDFDGVVNTQLGSLSADLQAEFNQTYSFASYGGKIRLNAFELGTMLSDTSFGRVTLEASLEGSGLATDSLQADLTATVKEVVYRKYAYNDIAIDGNLDKKKFQGKVKIEDENLLFDFSGIVDFNDSLPLFAFEAALDTVNLGALNLMENNVGIHADIKVDFRGLNVDDFNGNGSIKNIRIASDSIKYTMDSISAKAYTESPNNKIIEVSSPVVNMKVNGDFNAADLPKLLINYVNDYFPISEALDTVDRPRNLAIEPNKPVIADQKFEFLLTVSKPLKIAKMFVPAITRWDTAYIIGSFDSKEKSLQLDAAIPGLQYGDIKIDTAQLLTSGDKNEFVVSAILNDAVYDDKTTIPYAEVKLNMANDEMDASVSVGGDSIKRLGIGAHITRTTTNAFRASFADSLNINGDRWQIPVDNYIEYRPGQLSFHNVRLTHNNQELAITSPKDSATAIAIGFKNFNLHELSNLADYNDIKLDGNINGSVLLQNIYTKLSFLADVQIKDIYINDHQVGDLSVKASQQRDAIALNVNLTGGENQLVASGKILPDAGTMEVEADMKRLNLNAIDPFLPGYIGESEGYLSANLSVKGEFSEPAVDGKISFHNVSTKSTFANARFAVADNTLEVSPKRININRLQIFDEKKRQLAINGFLNHQNFQDIELDLSVNTDEFMFLNSAQKKSGFLYGTVVLGVNGKIKGPVTLPVVDARASTKPGTKVYVVPTAIETEIKQEDFVIFRKPPYDTIQNIDSLNLAVQQEYTVNLSGIDLNLAFELTSDAQLQIIIDPISGDSLTCVGSADLIIDLPPAGTPQITGAYIVESGSYSFSYQKLLKRKFTINKGSRIDFTGNIMNARLDINAQYTALATTYDLISTQSASLSESEIDAAKKRSPVYVVLKIKGDISRPELSFDIQLPSGGTNLVSSTVARKLALMRENPTEMNKQVFALLMFNNFMAEEGSDPNLEAAGENVVLRSVSNLVSNQLNRLANKIQGFEINLDLSSYRSKYETPEGNDVLTEVGLDISKQFLNDRLQVTVGGNVNVESASTSTGQSQGGFSAVTGDFTIEYKLSPSGRYRVKVYQTSDFDILNQSNVYRTGVGLTYRTSFRKLIKSKKDKQENKTVTP